MELKEDGVVGGCLSSSTEIVHRSSGGGEEVTVDLDLNVVVPDLKFRRHM